MHPVLLFMCCRLQSTWIQRGMRPHRSTSQSHMQEDSNLHTHSSKNMDSNFRIHVSVILCTTTYFAGNLDASMPLIPELQGITTP